MKYFIVHGHFYQPPREDPITNTIPFESGTAPYPNWNEKIFAECYQPNAKMGNFGQISFNFGPTLLQWMAKYHPDTVRSIIQQDQKNISLLGCGNAMAQSFNHTILPLQPKRDKRTQIRWGITDFESRFGRRPQGLWLPETAMDMETLETMTDMGIEFTILAPWQAKYDGIDLSQPYRIRLDRGKTITVFFFNSQLSSSLSFNPTATHNADRFVSTELNPLYSHRTTSQIFTIATDGELYGHHQQLRNYFLQRLVDGAAEPYHLIPTFPALWLKHNQVKDEMEVREFTSWSCHHGISRWLGNCSCTPGNGTWKITLMKILNNLAEKIDDAYFDYSRRYVDSPWSLRDEFIKVILSIIPFDRLLFDMTGKALPTHVVNCLSLLLKAQYERQRMFTSCGWFFDDFDRIEPRNNVAYAAQSVYLMRLATGDDFSSMFTQELEEVRSSKSGILASEVFQSHLQRAEISNFADQIEKNPARVNFIKWTN